LTLGRRWSSLTAVFDRLTGSTLSARRIQLGARLIF
jgi:hypothetical protein